MVGKIVYVLEEESHRHEPRGCTWVLKHYCYDVIYMVYKKCVILTMAALYTYISSLPRDSSAIFQLTCQHRLWSPASIKMMVAISSNIT